MPTLFAAKKRGEKKNNTFPISYSDFFTFMFSSFLSQFIQGVVFKCFIKPGPIMWPKRFDISAS